MPDPLTQVNLRRTRQTERAPGNEGARQVRNNAGGYVFQAGDEARILRFLTLGTTGGTYYVREQEHTVANAQFIVGIAQSNPDLLVRLVRDVSTAGRAPRQNATLFALAAACAFAPEGEQRTAALNAISASPGNLPFPPPCARPSL